MKLKPLAMVAILAASTLVFTACSTKHNNAGAMSGVGGEELGTLNSSGLGDSVSFNGDTSQMSYEQLLDIKTYYFSFDSDQITANDRPAVIAQAHYLSSNADKHVLLAGNTDSRGSREYNIALGLRRAQAVENLMLSNGARKDQIMVTSYGEEKPVATGDTEMDYARNRRVDLTYEN